MVKLAGLLTAGPPACLQPLAAEPMLELIRAVAAADARAFADAAATLTHAAVTVVGSDGMVIASSAEHGRTRSGAPWKPEGNAREILLRDGAGLHGAIIIGPDRPGAISAALADPYRLLADLGLALVTSIHSRGRPRVLENQLVMLSCLTGRDAGQMFGRDCAITQGAARRLVVMQAPAAIEGNAGARVLDEVVRAADRIEVLSGLSLVMSQGSLTGIYPDTDSRLARHRRSWTDVVRMARTAGPLTVVIGDTISDIGEFPAQHRLLREIAAPRR